MARLRSGLAALFSLILFYLCSPVYLLQNLWGHITDPSSIFNDNAVWSEQLYASVLTSVEEASKQIFPEAEHFEEQIKMLSDAQFNAVQESANLELSPEYDTVFRFHAAKKGEDVLGYTAEDVAPGKWGSIKYLVGFDPDGSIKDVVVIEYSEKRGKPVAKKRFLKQFRGKNADDAIRIMRDIRGVTGASISSNGVTNGIRKMTHVFAAVYGSR